LKLKIKSEKLKVQNSKNFDVGTEFMSARGITLIALIITIIVLIILAGVAINLSLGENGIFKRTEEAKQRQSESSVKEKLELALVGARIEKETNTSYNKEDFLTEMLEEENMTVDGDSVIVDNYNFIIDRENLTILESLGETQIKVTAKVQEYLGKNANDKYAVSMLIIIESNTGLQSVVIQNPDGTTFEIETQQAILGKDMEVELDEEYILTVTTKDEKIETRKIVEKSEEKIRTAEELATFRDKVNTGLTYEGKTINVVADLDLSSVCGEIIGSWEPIGISAVPFKGIFNGNYHFIDNLYINTTNGYQGLFGFVEATIKNINIKNSNITAAYYVGGISGRMSGTIDNCHIDKTVKITGSSNNGIGTYIGGIAGEAYGTVKNSSNEGNIVASHRYVGGIVGVIINGDILGFYNAGTVQGSYEYVGGIAGVNCESTTNITNCYNIGNITGYQYIGGIIGASHPLAGNLNINNVYNKGTVNGTQNKGEIIGAWLIVGTALNYYTSAQTATAELLGDAFTDDIQNVDGTWRHNNGSPILKWQLSE